MMSVWYVLRGRPTVGTAAVGKGSRGRSDVCQVMPCNGRRWNNAKEESREEVGHTTREITVRAYRDGTHERERREPLHPETGWEERTDQPGSCGG